jgi:hypothetical protein
MLPPRSLPPCSLPSWGAEVSSDLGPRGWKHYRFVVHGRHWGRAARHWASAVKCPDCSALISQLPPFNSAFLGPQALPLWSAVYPRKGV